MSARGLQGKRVALDLFSGTGGATAAFREHGWEVITVDNDPRHRADLIADIRTLVVTQPIDFLWASPPCTEFSDLPVGSQNRQPSLDDVFATLRIVRDLQPHLRFWVMENVRGALPFLGLPRQKIGPFCLWGYFPKIRPPIEAVDHRKMTPSKRNAIERAAIPYALSLALLEAVERSWNKKSIADLRPFRRHRQIAKLNRTGPAWRPSAPLGHVADLRSRENQEVTK